MAMIKTSELDYRSSASGTHNNEKELRPRVQARGDRIGEVIREPFGPSWRDGYTPEKGMSFFATPYVLNTKFVAGCKAAPNIGCIVTMASGEKLHLDLDPEQVERAGNQR